MTKRSETAGPNGERAAAWLKEHGPNTMAAVCAAFGWTSHVGIAALSRAQLDGLVFFKKPLRKTKGHKVGTWYHRDDKPLEPRELREAEALELRRSRSWGPIPELCKLLGHVPLRHDPPTARKHTGFSGAQRDAFGEQ